MGEVCLWYAEVNTNKKAIKTVDRPDKAHGFFVLGII